MDWVEREEMAEGTALSDDFNEHQRTYDGFIRFGKVGIVSTLTVLVCLIMFAFGGTAATIFGWILLFAMMIAAAIGLAGGANGWIAPTVVFVVSALAAIITVT